MCAAGTGYCYIFNENIDAVLMKSILNDILLPSADLCHLLDAPMQPWFFLHDNDKKFKSNLVTNILHNNGISCIDFPPYSPDLNPIENLWAVMARGCERRQCDTLEQLQDVVADEWDKIDEDFMRNLAQSMPARCQAVIDANGWHTKY